MPRKEQIDAFRQYYARLSDDELLKEKHQWVPHAEQYIAADLILAERKRKREGEAEKEARDRHGEVMNENKKMYRLTVWVLIVAIITLLATLYFGFFPTH